MALAEAPIKADAKRGFCGNCRGGSHAMCTAITCTCTDRFGHPRRSERSATPTRSPMPAPTRPAEGPTPPQIIWEDPPEVRSTRCPVDAATVTALRASPGRWARVKHYDKKTSAWTAARNITKGSLGPGFEARGIAAAAGSELYVRFVGK